MESGEEQKILSVRARALTRNVMQYIIIIMLLNYVEQVVLRLRVSSKTYRTCIFTCVYLLWFLASGFLLLLFCPVIGMSERVCTELFRALCSPMVIGRMLICSGLLILWTLPETCWPLHYENWLYETQVEQNGTSMMQKQIENWPEKLWMCICVGYQELCDMIQWRDSWFIHSFMCGEGREYEQHLYDY